MGESQCEAASARASPAVPPLFSPHGQARPGLRLPLAQSDDGLGKASSGGRAVAGG